VLAAVTVVAVRPTPAAEPGNAGAASVCAAGGTSTASLVFGLDRRQPVAVPRPAKGAATRDPLYGTCIVRATDHVRDGVEGFARNDYSRRQAFNADSTRFVVTASDGSWHLYDARTYRHLKVLPGISGNAEPQWHPTDPDLLRYFPRDGVGSRLYELDVANDRSRVLADLASKLPPGVPRDVVWTKGEGSPSADHRYWCLMAEDADFVTRWIFTYDLERQTVVGGIRAPEDPDHVSMSPSGAWCVASFDSSRGIVAYSRDFGTVRQLAGKGEHSDIAVDSNGDDVFVAIDYQSDRGDVYMYNLRTGRRTVLFPTYLQGSATAIHFSGKAFARPGWVLASTYMDDGGPKQWLHAKIFAVELRADPRVLNIAHHHSVSNGYWTEPHASVNRDFSRVIFNSNWGRDDATDVDAYVVELPPHWSGD
jgi:hypothetical protein